MKNIIITGASKGIGRAIAEKFAAAGHRLIICARHEAALEEARRALESLHPQTRVIAAMADLSREDEVTRFSHFVRQHWSRVDILVNNAGLFIPGAVVSEPDDTLRHMLDVNLLSAYHLSRQILPLMLPQRAGHIFNMCSIASIAAYPNGGSYTISKFALLGFSKVLRAELKDRGIKVTAILPGATWSDSWAGADYPEERLMQAHDIANAVFAAAHMSPSAVVEEIIIRPQLGDL